MFITVGGLTPMALAGGTLWQPMAIAIISGLIILTALTLYIIPTLYLLLVNFYTRDSNGVNRPPVNHRN